MDKTVLAFVEKLEIFKTKIKALHWDANSLSQHELCDDIAERIADFQDQVSEVEQSISGKLPKEMFKPTNQKFGEVGTLKEFVESVIDCTNEFYKKLGEKDDKYIGMRSDCESFLSDMQRKLYLVNFTLKEELKMRLKDKINESRPKNLSNTADVEKFMGRRPKSIKARINQIYRIVKKYGIDSRKYNDEHWQAIDDYYRAITSLGCEVELKPCGHLNNADSMESDGGYCDYDPYDHMPRSKQYAIRIMFEDGMTIDGYIKCMAAGTVSDPFASYDTCMVLWPKQNNVLENKNMSKQMRLTEAELKQVVKEAAMKILSETPLNYDIDNFSGRWNKSEPSDEEWALADSAANGDYLDNPFNPPNSWDDDEWVDGDKDMENDYSWDRFDGKPIAQGLDPYYKVGKGVVGREVDDAISRRNRENDWSERELRNRDRMMNKYVNGERDADDIGDAWDDIHYESKKPMKVTEAELKQVVKEAAISLIQEYTQKQANTKGFIKSTYGHRSQPKRKQKQAKGSFGEREKKLLKQMGKEVDESINIDPKNKGKFTATKKATGKSTEELTHSKNPLTRKRANFAKMAKRHWKPLKESDYMDDGNLESQYGKNPDSMWTYGTNLNPSVVDGLEPNQVRHAGNGNIKNDNNASWDYFDAVSNGADMKMRNRLDADYRERTNNSPFNASRKRMDMDVAFPRQTPNERFKQDLDKQWKDTQDIEKYSRQADSRPLHRKGSLNRA